MYILEKGKIRQKPNHWVTAALLAVLLAVSSPILAPMLHSEDEELDYDSFYAASYQIGPYWWQFIDEVSTSAGEKVLHIKIDEHHFDGSDKSCEEFSRMMVYLTRKGWIVEITNDGWIPSEERVINHEYAKWLASDPYVN